MIGICKAFSELNYQGEFASVKLVFILYSYFMPVCHIVKTITLRLRGLPDALLGEAEG